MLFRVLVSSVLVSFALPCLGSLTACGDDSPSDETPSGGSDAGDAGSKPDADRERPDAATDARAPLPTIEPERCAGELPVMKARIAATNEVVDPDWSCYDAAPAPTEPMPGDADFDAGPSGPVKLVTFRRGPSLLLPLIADVTIDLFLGPSTLGMPAVTRVLDPDSGGITVEVPAGVETVSARIHPLMRDDPMFSIPEFREYGFPVPATAAPIIEGYVLLRASRDLIVSSVFGAAQQADPERAMIVSSVRDCQGRDVSGGQLDLLDGETDLPVATGTAPGEPHTNYFQFALPSTTGCTFTSNDQAAWVMIDAPTNVAGDAITHPYRLRLTGRMRASDAKPVVIGERDVELVAGAVTFVRLYR